MVNRESDTFEDAQIDGRIDEQERELDHLRQKLAELEAERAAFEAVIKGLKSAATEFEAENERLRGIVSPLYDFLTGNCTLNASQLEELADKSLALLENSHE